MKVSIEWLKDYTPVTMPVKTFCDGMTMSGSKVEDHYVTGDNIRGVVTGKVSAIERHPGADKLFICQVDVGGRTLQIITGADNVHAGDCVPVALDGSELPDGTRISAGMLRGQVSEGMLCSLPELGLTSADFPYATEDGILILPDQTPAGLRIQEVLGLDDTIIDFEITSNRVDCFCVEGIAREAAVTFDLPFQPVRPSVKAAHTDESSRQASISIDAPDLCYRYCGRVIRNVTVTTSPDWMRRRLRAAGMRPINNIVDITNYVMLELGQPMHAFDLTALSGREIRVRRALPGETIRTLDRVDRKLDTDMLVIADADRAVALAGVMGAENSEISGSTRTILLESATFNPVSVRQAALKAGLRTEASSRFEKGLDVYNAARGMDRACELIELTGAGEVCRGMIDVWPYRPDPVQIMVSPASINRLLGTDINGEWMAVCLKKLGLEVEKRDNIYQAVIPSYRPDLLVEADIAEEIARFFGYNQIQPSLLSGKQTTLGGLTLRQKMLEKVKDLMIGQGFYEACTYSFEGPKQLDRLNVPAGHALRRSIRIQNPLGEEYACMRTSMLPSLLEVAATNWSRSVDNARIFEIARVYLAAGLPLEKLPDEELHLTAFAYETDTRRSKEKLFFEMKGVVEELLLQMGVQDVRFTADASVPWLHPGQTAKILLQGRSIGHLGLIHPDVAANFSVPDQTAIIDILAEPVLAVSDEKRIIRPLPRYPSVSRDLALIADAGRTAEDLFDAIHAGGEPYLEKIVLFDVYQGPQVPAGKKSVAYSLVFRSPDRTLNEEDITTAMKSILASLMDRCGATIRET